MVDNSGLSAQGTSVSLAFNMRRSGLGKGLGTLMEPAPVPGKPSEGAEGAVRLFLRTPEKPTVAVVEEPSIPSTKTVLEVSGSVQSLGWIPCILFALDALLIGVAVLLLGVATMETGKLLALGSVVIGVAGSLGVMGVWLWRQE